MQPSTMRQEHVVALLVSAVAICYTSAGPQTALSPSSQVIDAAITPAPATAATGAPLPISNSSPAVTGAPLPISNPVAAVTGAPLPISSPSQAITGAPLPISNPIKAVTGVPLPISSSSQAVTGTPLPAANSMQAVTGVPLFSIDTAISSNMPTTLQSTVPSPISKSNVQPTNPFTVTLANPTPNTTPSGTNSHIAPEPSPAVDPNLRLLADLLGNLNIDSDIDVHHEHPSNPNANPNINLIAELLADQALGEFNPVDDDPELDFFAEFFVDSTSNPVAGPINDQVALTSANPRMKLLAKLFGSPSTNPLPNIVSNNEGDSFHDPYANPVTDLASKSGANTESHPAHNLFNKHFGVPLINFIKNPLGSLFDKYKDKMQSESPLTRLFPKHAKKMETLGNLFQSLLPRKEEANSDQQHSPLPTNLDDIARSRRRVVMTKIAERIQSLRQIRDPDVEKRKLFFGDCSSSSMPSCDRSSSRSKRGFRRLKPVLNFMRSVLRIFGIDIPDKLFNLVSGIVAGPNQNNATTSSQSSTENVVKSDVQYLIC